MSPTKTEAPSAGPFHPVGPQLPDNPGLKKRFRERVDDETDDSSLGGHGPEGFPTSGMSSGFILVTRAT